MCLGPFDHLVESCRKKNRKPMKVLNPPQPITPHHHHHHRGQSSSSSSSGGGGNNTVASFGFFGFLWKARRKDKDLPPSNQDEHKLYLEQDVLERRIPDSDLRQLVELPSGLDYNEWLASHTLAFFEHINLIYGTISEFCTMSGCPDMVGPCQRQYQWYDEKGKKCKVAAPQYTDYVMTFTQKTINDECIFPSKFGNEFPTSFESIVKKIHRLLFHVVAHLYCAHFKEIWMLALHTHLNCLFAHMVLFNERFKLIEDKETEILNDLVIALKLHSSDSSVPTENEGGRGGDNGNGSGSSGGNVGVCDTTDETTTTTTIVDKTIVSLDRDTAMMMMMGGTRLERDDEEQQRPPDLLATPDLVLTTTGVDIKLQQ